MGIRTHEQYKQRSAEMATLLTMADKAEKVATEYLPVGAVSALLALVFGLIKFACAGGDQCDGIFMTMYGPFISIWLVMCGVVGAAGFIIWIHQATWQASLLRQANVIYRELLPVYHEQQKFVNQEETPLAQFHRTQEAEVRRRMIKRYYADE